MNEAVVKSSRYAYADTIIRLGKAIGEAGNTIFADIDQSAVARSVGLTLRPTRLLIFGNPKGGTPLMDTFPLVALDLPLKLLVWEESGEVKVAFTPAATIARRYEVTGKDPIVAAMDHALETIVAAVLRAPNGASYNALS